MTYLRIIEVTGGKFALQERIYLHWVFTCDIRYHWYSNRLVNKYCLVDSLEEAEYRLDLVIDRIQRMRIKPIKIKVLRVIKKVKV